MTKVMTLTMTAQGGGDPAVERAKIQIGAKVPVLKIEFRTKGESAKLF